MAIKITDILFTLISINAGIITLFKYPEYWPLVLAIIIGGSLLILFSNYTSLINKNKEEITNLKKEIKINEKLLYTLKDILIIKKMNQKAQQISDNIIEVIKIILIIILAAIIVKAIASGL